MHYLQLVEFCSLYREYSDEEKVWQRIARECRWREKKDANETTKTRSKHSSRKRLG